MVSEARGKCEYGRQFGCEFQVVITAVMWCGRAAGRLPWWARRPCPAQSGVALDLNSDESIALRAAPVTAAGQDSIDRWRCWRAGARPYARPPARQSDQSGERQQFRRRAAARKNVIAATESRKYINTRRRPTVDSMRVSRIQAQCSFCCCIPHRCQSSVSSVAWLRFS